MAELQSRGTSTQAWANRNLTEFGSEEGQAGHPGQDNPGHRCRLGGNRSALLRRTRRRTN